MNKQGAIEEIRKGIELAHEQPKAFETFASWSQVIAEDIYDRIAPLREFPEKIARELWRRYRAAGDDWVKHPPQERFAFDQLMVDFKRLWEGTDKGGCPTCGGSGKNFVGFLPAPQYSPCPDCGGTGERRQRQQRQGEEGVGTVKSVDGGQGVRYYKCGLERQQWLDRRDYIERREEAP